MKILYFSFSLILILLLSAFMNRETGKKQVFQSQVNQDQREYIVYSPVNYDPSRKYPLVFMLHGGSGNGEKFYRLSGWNELADKEGIIVVYPTSWEYDVNSNGCGNNLTTRWNNYRTVEEVCDPDELRDDVQFASQMLDEICSKYSIDQQRIYMSGFSNGGGMSLRLAVELSDCFAAVSMMGSSFPIDTLLKPQSFLPMHYIVGTADAKILAATSFVDSLPFNHRDLLQDSSFAAMSQTYIHSFDLNPNFELLREKDRFRTIRYKGNSGNPHHFLDFSLVKDLEHKFPNPPRRRGMAEVFWNFMKKYKLP